MKRFALVFLFVLSISASFYSQSTCKEEDKQRARRIGQKLEADIAIKFSIERGDFGDCIHYDWMDEMREFGVKQVEATLKFVWKDGIKMLELEKIYYLQKYYRYDSEIKDKVLIKKIEDSGLKKKLAANIFNKTIELIPKILKEKRRASGTIYQTLLDDSALPILRHMTNIDSWKN